MQIRILFSASSPLSVNFADRQLCVRDHFANSTSEQERSGEESATSGQVSFALPPIGRQWRRHRWRLTSLLLICRWLRIKCIPLQPVSFVCALGSRAIILCARLLANLAPRGTVLWRNCDAVRIAWRPSLRRRRNRSPLPAGSGANPFSLPPLRSAPRPRIATSRSSVIERPSMALFPSLCLAALLKG